MLLIILTTLWEGFKTIHKFFQEAKLHSSFLTESSGGEDVQLWRLPPSETSCFLSWSLCLLDHSVWQKAFAMFWAALWRDPDGREARQTHSQCGMKSLGSQASSYYEAKASWQPPPWEWPWRWSLQARSPCRMIVAPPLNSLTAVSWKTLSQNNPAKPLPDPCPRL